MQPKKFFLKVQQFEKLATSDPSNLIDISPVTGDVINNQILDFEAIKEIQVQVPFLLKYLPCSNHSVLFKQVLALGCKYFSFLK